MIQPHPHLRESAASFGFSDLANRAEQAGNTIPQGNLSKAKILPGARIAFENLTSAIDDLLTENSIYRD